MKKKMILTLALIAGILTASADNSISASAVVIPQGGVANVSIELNNDVEFTAFTMRLLLPSGVSYVAYDRGPRYEDHGITANNGDEGVSFACLSLKNTLLSGNSGELLNVTLSADTSLPVGTVLSATLSELTFTTPAEVEYLLDDVVIPITIGELLPVALLDENSETAPQSSEQIDVTVSRSIKAGEWSTICLPFSMSGSQVKAVFGDDVQIADFSEWSFEKEGDEVTSITLNFTMLTADDGMEKNHPYVIKLGTDITQFSLHNVVIDPVEYPSNDVDYKVTTGSGRNQKTTTYYGHMYGYYARGPIEAEGELFLSGNKFWCNVGNTIIKAYRATFYLEDSDNNAIMLSDGQTASSRVTMTFGNGESAGIDSITDRRKTDCYYDMQGRRVEKPVHGIYVKNGEKVIIK